MENLGGKRNARTNSALEKGSLGRIEVLSREKSEQPRTAALESRNDYSVFDISL